MNITWDNIYLAIQIVVTVQLVLGIVLNVFELKLRNILLAYLCFLIVYSYNSFFLYPSYDAYIHKSIHIFSGYIYFGPTLYLYLKSLLVDNLINKEEVLKHYLVPFIICLCYNIWGGIFYDVIVYMFLIGYSLASIKVSKKIINVLSGAMQKRFIWFIGMTFVYLLFDTPMLIIEDLAILGIAPFSDLYPDTNEFFYSYFHFPLLFSHFFILSLYATTEISRFKKFFLSKTLKESGVDQRQLIELKHKFENLFQNEKIYLDNNLSLDSMSKKVGLEKSLVSKFLKETYKKGFNDFINQYRIEEFKKILTKEEFKNFDLVGLARESGFKSKATFYRVFKEMEGVTPNQYKKSLEKVNAH